MNENQIKAKLIQNLSGLNQEQLDKIAKTIEKIPLENIKKYIVENIIFITCRPEIHGSCYLTEDWKDKECVIFLNCNLFGKQYEKIFDSVVVHEVVHAILKHGSPMLNALSPSEVLSREHRVNNIVKKLGF